MAESHQIAVIGEYDLVMGYQAIGLGTFPAADADEARRIIHKLAEENTAIIYLSETYAEQLGDVLQKYKSAVRPAITIIPGLGASLGLAEETMTQAIIRAVGADLKF